MLSQPSHNVLWPRWMRLPVLLRQAPVIGQSETEEVKYLTDFSFYRTDGQLFRNVVEQFCMLVDHFRYRIQVVFQLTHIQLKLHQRVVLPVLPRRSARLTVSE